MFNNYIYNYKHNVLTMNLKKYLEKNKILKQELAKDINITYTAICSYIRGSRIPRKEIFKSIFLNTYGKVQPNDFFPIEDWKFELKYTKQLKKQSKQIQQSKQSEQIEQFYSVEELNTLLMGNLDKHRPLTMDTEIDMNTSSSTCTERNIIMSPITTKESNTLSTNLGENNV